MSATVHQFKAARARQEEVSDAIDAVIQKRADDLYIEILHGICYPGMLLPDEQIVGSPENDALSKFGRSIAHALLTVSGHETAYEPEKMADFVCNIIRQEAHEAATREFEKGALQ